METIIHLAKGKSNEEKVASLILGRGYIEKEVRLSDCTACADHCLDHARSDGHSCGAPIHVHMG
jgi:hypothetical protein